MWIPKGYHLFKLISPVQQQTKMAEMLVKRKRGTGKPVQKKKIGMRKPAQKKKAGTRKPVQKKKAGTRKPTQKKKKTGNNSVNKPKRKNTTVKRVKKSIRGRRTVQKDIFL